MMAVIIPNKNGVKVMRMTRMMHDGVKYRLSLIGDDHDTDEE